MIYPKGFISIVCLLVGMSISALGLSVMTLHMNDLVLQQSSTHRIRAQYLAESGMEMTLYHLHQWSENAISAYFHSSIESSDKILALEPYLEAYMLHPLYAKPDEISVTSLYPEYLHEHGIHLSVDPSTDGKTLKIKIQGYYSNARVFLDATVRMPSLVIETDDLGNTEIRVKSLYLESLVQGYPDI